MSKFIELTTVTAQTLININQIIRFYPKFEYRTNTRIEIGSGYIDVIEIYEQVKDLIKKPIF